MRLAHKRKVQLKLQKRIKVAVVNLKTTKKFEATVDNQSVAEKKVTNSAVVTKVTEIALTAKQQQVFDIVVANPEGINAKGIGLSAGQEEAKAASWATGALKKLLEENLVVKEQLAGNKVSYKAV